MKSMSCVLSICLALLAPAADAQPVFASGFEDSEHIAPLFPIVDGQFQLPPGPVTDRITWLLGELAAGQSTTAGEVQANFDASWLAQIDVAQTQTFIQSLRTTYPDAVIRDVVAFTPVAATLVIATPGAPPPYGYLQIRARYVAPQRITQLGVSSYYGSVQYIEDQSLTLTQAVDKFSGLSPSSALWLGRIGSSGQCVAMEARQPDQPRAVASVFKSWVLEGLGRSINEGHIGAAESLPLIASEIIANGSAIATEPLDTPFPVRDLAILMMGISDNTATDLLHERIGRTRLASAVNASGMAQPDRLLPFLGISEQFHLFYSFPLATSLAYINGTEAYQADFLQTQIEPLGPLVNQPYFHPSLLTTGSWQATASDVCRMFSSLRRLPAASPGRPIIDAAFGSAAGQPEVRNRWDRVWYKGGSLGSAAGLHVLTHVWMLENAGSDPYVLVALSNRDAGDIDVYAVQSVTGRILELLSQQP